MNQTNNESQKRKWGCGGCLLAFVVVLALLVVTRITLVWQDREAQTKQLYALATQLGYAADSEVLQDRDWYCIEWDMFGRQKCTVFLSYTTTLDAEQMKEKVQTIGVKDFENSNYSYIPKYLLSDLRRFVPDTTYSSDLNSPLNQTPESEITVSTWNWNTDNSNPYFYEFHYIHLYEVATLAQPFMLDGQPIRKNIAVLYGQFHISWIF